MRKILIAVILIGLVSCTQSTVEKRQTNIVINNGHSKLNIVEIEGCEYFFSNYDRGAIFEHKGNCKNPIHPEHLRK